MTGRVASLARIAPAALQRAADVVVSFVFWADSLVNRSLTSPWSGWTSTCDPSSDSPGTRENAGNDAWQVLLDWGGTVVHACPADGQGVTGCCGRTPFELPVDDGMTTEARDVTCGGSS